MNRVTTNYATTADVRTERPPGCKMLAPPTCNGKPMISVVIPVFNEAESLPILHDELVKVAAKARLELDVWFVDDGSTDKSWVVFADMAERQPCGLCVGLWRHV